MKNLKTAINKLENKIALENSLIECQLLLLRDKLRSPKVILIGAFASFTIGYLFTRRKTTMLLLKRLTRSAFTIFRLYRRIKFLLPMGVI